MRDIAEALALIADPSFHITFLSVGPFAEKFTRSLPH